MSHWWKWLPVVAVVVGLGALAVSFAGARITPAQAAAPAKARFAWPQWINPTSKIVPIVSAGTPGIRLGLAQVRGPKAKVDRVRAVLQVDGDFKSVRAKMLVPSDSYTDLRRVQGTAVTAVAQYQLVTFGTKQKPAPQYEKKHGYPGNGHHKGWSKKHGKGGR